MKRILLLVQMVAGLFGYQAFAATLEPSTTLPTVGTPEHVYTITSGSNFHMDANTMPTKTYANFGWFAFYKVEGEDNVYYIYSTTANKWLTYEVSDSYAAKQDFVTLSDEKDENCKFFVGEVDGGAAYEFSPAATDGNTTQIYLNWLYGPASNTGHTVGLWTDSGSKDAGSKWILKTKDEDIDYNSLLPEGGPYAINFNKQIPFQRTDRRLSSITITNQDGTEKVIDLSSAQKPYVDLTANADAKIECKQGDELTVKLDYNNSWMHGYVYIDTNKDEAFSYNDGNADQSGTELYAFNYYQGKNHKGEDKQMGSAGWTLPAFKVIQEKGEYRIRFKIDWDNVDPGGCKGNNGNCLDGGGNPILGNGGYIVDATLSVVGVNAIETVQGSNNNVKVEYYDLQGRRLNAEPAQGVYIKKAEKIVKVIK